MRDAFEAYIQGVSHLRNSEVEQAITVNAYPIAAARGFWEEIGYDPHPATARVVTKDVA